MILQAIFSDRILHLQKYNKTNSCWNGGFTLIELIIVLSIMIVLSIAAVPIYGNLQVNAQLNENTSHIIQLLRTAREYSVAGLNNSSHGVFFEITPSGNDKIILYKGETYLSRDVSYDKTNILEEALSISTTITGNDISFSKGLGVPNNIGIITLDHSVEGNRVITVNSLGGVEEE